MIIFNSLKEVSDFAHNLIINHSVRDLRKINPEIIIDFTLGASTFLTIVTNRFANKLGHKINGCYLVWVYNEGCTSTWLARYYNSLSYIEYTAKLFFCYSYECILETIVHEICHCKYRYHEQVFWDYLFENLKTIDLIPSNTQFQDYFSSHKKYYGSNEILYFANWETLPDAYVKYDVIRRNKAFDLSDRAFNSRKFSTDYHNYVCGLEKKYNAVMQNETGFD